MTGLFVLVHHQGFEPWTPWLRVRCSASWANGAHYIFCLCWPLSTKRILSLQAGNVKNIFRLFFLFFIFYFGAFGSDEFGVILQRDFRLQHLSFHLQNLRFWIFYRVNREKQQRRTKSSGSCFAEILESSSRNCSFKELVWRHYAFGWRFSRNTPTKSLIRRFCNGSTPLSSSIQRIAIQTFQSSQVRQVNHSPAFRPSPSHRAHAL